MENNKKTGVASKVESVKFDQTIEIHKLLEWKESQFIRNIKAIMISTSKSQNIHEVELDDGDRVYLVSEEVYSAAKKVVRAAKIMNDREEEEL